MAIESEMLADAGRHGLRITEVEISVRYDVDGSTENPIKHGFGVLMMVLKDIEFNRPLYYLTLPGSILGIIGLIMGVIFLREFILGKNLYFGPTMLMVLYCYREFYGFDGYYAAFGIYDSEGCAERLKEKRSKIDFFS